MADLIKVQVGEDRFTLNIDHIVMVREYEGQTFVYVNRTVSPDVIQVNESYDDFIRRLGSLARFTS